MASANPETKILLALLRDQAANKITKLSASVQWSDDKLLKRVELLETLWSIGLGYLVDKLGQQNLFSWPLAELRISKSWGLSAPTPDSREARPILLLSLRPSEDSSAAIVCDVYKTDTGNPRAKYEVLSHVPKPGSEERTIQLCVKAKTREQSVPESLFNALVRLRYLRKRRVLWIDSLCFNWNHAENDLRASVDHWKEIHVQSSGIVAWLGPESNILYGAFAAIKAFANTESHEQALKMGLFHRRVLEAILKLLRSPWWNRYPIMRHVMEDCEVTFVCGNVEASGKEFENFFRQLAKQVPSIMRLASAVPPQLLSIMCLAPTDILTNFWARTLAKPSTALSGGGYDDYFRYMGKELFSDAMGAVPGASCPELPSGEIEASLYLDAMVSELERLLSEHDGALGCVLALSKMSTTSGFLFSHLGVRISGRYTRRRRAEMVHTPPLEPIGEQQLNDAVSETLQDPDSKEPFPFISQWREYLRNKNLFPVVPFGSEMVEPALSIEEHKGPQNLNRQIMERFERTLSIEAQKGPEENVNSEPQQARSKDLCDTKNDLLRAIARATKGESMGELVQKWVKSSIKRRVSAESRLLNDSDCLDCWLGVLATSRPGLNSWDYQETPSIEETTGGGSYSYEPLDRRKQEIRVLLLHPDDDPEATLRCELLTIDLGILSAMGVSRMPFMALSYVWNDESHVDRSHDPEIMLHNTKKPVTANLYSMLRRLRDPELATLVWVDALCINQQSDEERNQQVLLMKSIYQRAGHVIMWLGEEEEDTWQAMVPLCLHDYLRTLRRYSLGIDKKTFTWFDKILKYMHYANNAFYTVGFNKLLYRKYWERVWIVQEVLLAQDATVCVGSTVGNWTTFMGVLGRYGSVKFLTNRGYHGNYKPAAHQVVDLYGRPNDDLSLLEVLLLGENRRATIKHDYIYAFLGLTNLDKQSIEPNYSDNFQKVCLDAFRRIIGTSKDLDILSYGRRSEADEASENKGVDPWPSWLPDWSIKPTKIWEDEMSALLTERGRQCYKASGKSESYALISDDGKTLKLKIVAIDIIGHISPVPWPVGSEWNWNLYQLYWVKRGINPYRTLHKLRLAFAYLTFLGQPFHSKKSLAHTYDENKAIKTAEEELEFKLNTTLSTNEDHGLGQLTKLGFKLNTTISTEEDSTPGQLATAEAEINNNQATNQTISEEDKQRGDDESVNPVHKTNIDAGSPCGTEGDEGLEDAVESQQETQAGLDVEESKRKEFSNQLMILTTNPELINTTTDEDESSSDSDTDSEPDPDEVLGDHDKFMAMSFEKSENDTRWAPCYIFRSRFFITAGGLIGRGPMDLQQEDLVCVVMGAKVPFILRPTDVSGQTKRFRIIGDAYVHGHMKGGVMKEKGVTPEVVEIE